MLRQLVLSFSMQLRERRGAMSNHAPKHASGLDRLLLNDAIDAEILLDEPASAHTTYQCGGNFKYFATANSISALQQILRTCEEGGVETYIIGKGSNLLVADSGFDGMAVALGMDFRHANLDEDAQTIVAGAGVSFAKVSQMAYSNNMSGLEFSVGIPGTIGGALGMNAGTCGVGLCDVVLSVSILDASENWRLRKLTKEDFNYGYHHSTIADFGVAVECAIPLTKTVTSNLKTDMEEKLRKRNATQPLGHNCGSVFKNPEGDSAGRLIEECGLKGKRIGGAEISELHANFFPNVDGASAQDVVDLINLAQSEVETKFGVKLEPEVQLLGF